MHRKLRGRIVGWGLAVCCVSVVMSVSAAARSREEFAPTCNLPFQAIARTHPIDKTCGIQGNTKSVTARAQNRAKNNLCATGTAIPVTMADLRSLQNVVGEAGIPFGFPSRLPPDRTLLEGLIVSGGGRVGEGSLVQFVGFVLEAHVSDRQRGESVNCNVPGDDSNDIHITLAEAPGEEMCDGFVAEMIPHFRPASWTAGSLTALRGRPVRVTGHLLFDASHQPCRDGRRVGSNPLRASLWEIHPVYAVDVCSEVQEARCKAGDSRAWIPLHEWIDR